MEVSVENEAILSINNLKTHFFVQNHVYIAVDNVSISVKRGTTLAVVGESGCGKSMLASSVMRIVPDPPGKIVGGEVVFKGENLINKTEKQMEEIRGGSISMIFQEPMTSLNPVFRIGKQISESLLIHQYAELSGRTKSEKKKSAMKKSIDLMEMVGIPDAPKRAHDYPHRLSGGMRQRVMIAMALASEPDLLIADEPTTALDVTVQAQILELLENLQKELHTTIILITHDFGVVAEVSDYVAVMYAGQIIEQSPTDMIFENPLHPYTIGLLRSVPRIDADQGELFVIEGVVPNSAFYPVGCRFANRCTQSKEICFKEMPELREAGGGRSVRCHFANITGIRGADDGRDS